MKHLWRPTTFDTGAMICDRCNLYPVDPEDFDTPCPITVTVRALVPVDIVIEDGEVTRVVVQDEIVELPETDVLANDVVLELGIDREDATQVAAVVNEIETILNDSDWPAWEMGY